MATNYLIRKIGVDTNGGTSQTVRSTGTDGIVNTTAGLTKVTSITSTWSAADIGHGIYTSSSSKYSIVTAYTAGTTATVTTVNTSTTVTSAALFSAGMVGQAITGPGIAANSVVTVFTNSSSITISIAAGVAAGTGTGTFYNMLTVGTNMAAATGQTWNVGGAWLTIAQALVTTTTAITNGDKVYVGAGVYREVNTVGITSPTAEVQIIADVDGVLTSDVGEVILSAYISGDRVVPSSSPILNLNGRDFLTFQKITFVRGTGNAITATTATSTDITFSDCTFYAAASPGSANLIGITVGFAVAANWTLDRCRFFHGSTIISVVLTTGSGSDYDANILIRNCIFFGTSATAVSVTNSGTSANEGGGVDVLNCTVLSGSGMATSGTRVSLTIPCTINNCLILAGGGTGINSGEAGAITENFNLIFATTPRTNVTAGANSISDGTCCPHFAMGQELAIGQALRPFFSLCSISSALGFGNVAGATVDLLNIARPNGSILKADTGTATAGGAKTLTNSGKTWGTNVWLGYVVKIISGTGSGQTKSIASNTATVLTLDGNWKTNPDNTSVYMIYLGAYSSSGTATAGTTTTLTDANAAWGVNSWAGYTLKIDGGTGSPQSLTVVSNTATVHTFAAATAPDATSTYKLFRGTDENTINAGIGCYERNDTPVKETGTVRTGSNALRLQGAGTFDIVIPVAAASTAVTVYTQFDSAYAGTKPQLLVLNGTECGVANATATAVGSANTWEQLTLTIVPTSIGVVTLRLQSSCTAPTGTAFFDDFLVV